MFQGVVIEQAFKDVPKRLTNLAESAVIVGRDLVDRLWKIKAEIDRRVADVQNKEDPSTKSNSLNLKKYRKSMSFIFLAKTATQRSSTKATTASMF
jgi:predicted oxidoreductase (fatty acid repression mutant protein)